MVDRYVVSKSRKVRIGCDGPLTAEIERTKLEESMKAAGQEPDVEIEYLKKAAPTGTRQRWAQAEFQINELVGRTSNRRPSGDERMVGG